MRSGALIHRLEIQSSAETQSTAGGQKPSWSSTPFATVWGRVETLSGRESFVGDVMRPEASHRVTIRALAGLTTAHRIKFGARYLDIVSIANVEERGVEMRLLCHEGTEYGA